VKDATGEILHEYLHRPALVAKEVIDPRRAGDQNNAVAGLLNGKRDCVETV
jgi:hypothetical protein